MTTFLGSLTELPTVVIVLLKMTLLLGAGWMFHFALVRRNPRWRVLVWRGVMAGMILLPVGELLLPKLQISVAPPPVLEEPVAPAVEHEPVTPVQSDTYVAPVASEQVGDTPKPFSVLLWAKQHPSFLLLTGWGLISLILAVRVICVTHRVRRVVRASEPAPERIRRLMEKVAEDLRCRIRVDLRVTAGLGSPFLAGVIRPVLVLPERMTDERHAGELPAVFAHELAHLHAHDLIWIVVGKWLAVLWWFHPLAWTARAAYIGACEEVCDAVAADYVGGAPSYSRTLARAALELVVDAPAPGGIPMIRTSDITRRLRNLKRGIKAAALARPWVAVGILVGCFTLVVLGSLQLVRAGRRGTGKPPSFKLGQMSTFYTFGPVIERWINDNDAGENFSIDFDTGRLWDLYPIGRGPEIVRSSDARGIDAFVDVSGKPKNIICADMIVIAADHVWDGDPEAIAKRLLGSKPGSPIYMSAEGELPKSYIFKTHGFGMPGGPHGLVGGFSGLREGMVGSATATGMGVLQILEMSDKIEPRGVRIRYKMIEETADISGLGPLQVMTLYGGFSQEMPETEEYTFGPVVERWINDNDAGKDFGIDFDTGLLGIPLPEGAKGLDGIVDVSGKPKNIICSDMVVMAADHVWDGDPNAIAQRLEGGTPGSPIYMSAEGELPKSFIFKTDERGMGILQILEMSDRTEPRGVRIRYKLIQWEDAGEGRSEAESREEIDRAVSRPVSPPVKAEGAQRSGKTLGSEERTPWMATLANGVTVELVGVSHYPSTGRAWWRPDGSPLAKRPYDEMNMPALSSLLGPGHFDLEYAVQLYNLPEEPVRTEFHIYNSGTSAVSNQLLKDGRPVEGLYAKAASHPRGLTGNTVKVRFGVAGAAWQTLAETRRTENGFALLVLVGEREHEVRGEFLEPTEVNGSAQIAVATNLDKADQDVRVVAEDWGGAVHVPLAAAVNTSGMSGTQITTVRFRRLPFDRVKLFKLQVRPIEWVSFEGVAIDPDSGTDVHVQLEDVAKVHIGKRMWAAGVQDVPELVLPANARFSQVSEVTVCDTSVGSNSFIDFDTGQLHARSRRSPKDLSTWARNKGIDAFAELRMKGLVRIGMAAVDVSNAAWDEFTPKDVTEALHGCKVISGFPISGRGPLPATYAVLTHERGMGILQIIELSDRIEPRGVRIRYKMIQREETAEVQPSPEIMVGTRAAEAAAERPSASATDISEGRVVRFPEDRSLGKLKVRDEGAYTHWDAGWEPLCEAMGTVRVPAGKELRLEVGIEVAKDLSPLTELGPDDVHHVTLRGTEVRDDALKHLAHLTGLRGLDLTYTQITDAGVAQIGKFRSLRGVSLYGTGVTDDGLAPLEDLTSLKWLVLGRTNIGDRGLAHLAGLTAMERLSLQSTKITGAGLVHLKRMRSLKFLDVHNTRVGNAGLAHLKGLPALETLQLPQQTGISDAGLAHLADAPQLKSLFLVSQAKVTDAGLAHLAKTQSLERLFVGSFNVTDTGMVHLAKLARLRHLSLLGCAVTDDGLANLRPLKLLERLELHHTDVGGAGFVHLKALPLLRHLELHDLDLTDVGFKRLGELAELETLALYFIAVSDAVSDDDMVHLANLKRLKHLEINSKMVTDTGFRHLAALNQLEYVSAWGAKLTDESLGYLSNKDNLERLHITGHFTDEGLRHLEGLPSLSHLEINGSFSDEALAQLKRETPSLQDIEVRAPPWITVVPEGSSREPVDSVQ